jgi:hypothetical protein
MNNLNQSVDEMKEIVEMLEADAEARGKYGESSIATLKRIIAQRDDFEGQIDDLPDKCPHEDACNKNFLENYEPEKDEP